MVNPELSCDFIIVLYQLGFISSLVSGLDLLDVCFSQLYYVDINWDYIATICVLGEQIE